MLRRILCITFLLLAVPLYAYDHITNFRSDIVVNSDSSLSIKETITFVAEEVDPDSDTESYGTTSTGYGICRIIPTRYHDAHGNQHIIEVKVLRVLRDGGYEEPWRTTASWRSRSIDIGDHSNYISNGEHTYTIFYKVNYALSNISDQNELYWHVTGYDFDVPIENAQAFVTFPSGVQKKDIGVKAYRVLYDQRNTYCRTSFDERNRLCLTNTSPLSDIERLILVARWPKGTTIKPNPIARTLFLLLQNMNNLILWTGVIWVLILSMATWRAYGFDTKRASTIIPICEPPDGLSPAALRYVRDMGSDNRTFAAAILNMAVKGAITISDRNYGEYDIHRAGRKKSALTKEEAVLMRTLLDENDFEFRNTNYEAVQAATEEFDQSLENRFKAKYFSLNYDKTTMCVIISIIAILLGIVTSYQANRIAALLLTGWCAFLTILSAVYISRAVAARRITREILIYGFLVLCVGVASIIGLVSILSPIFAIGIFILALTNGLLFITTPAFTEDGRALHDKIQGFAIYLSVAQMTPEEFERNLPYALALDVEGKCAKNFAKAIETTGQQYRPTWYTGTQWNEKTSPAKFLASLANLLAIAVGWSSTKPNDDDD